MQRLITNIGSQAFLGAALLAAALVIGASAASAASKALVDLEYRAIGANVGTYNLLSGTLIADVGTTATTPSVMWSAGQVAGSGTGMWANPPVTVYSTRVFTWSLSAGALQKSHPNAPTGMITIVPQTKVTTACMLGLDPGNCTDRPGTMQVTPGVRKYGGTARMIVETNGHALYGATVGYSHLYWHNKNIPGPGSVSRNYNWIDAQTFVNTLFPGSPVNVTGLVHQGPATTGVVRAYNDRVYVTTETQAGSFNLNTANLTGMISVVEPRLLYSNLDTGGGTYGGTTWVQSSVYRTTLTFLPEPGQLAMLGFGIVSLAGLHGLRRR